MPDVSINGPVVDTGTGEYDGSHGPVTYTEPTGYPPTGAAGDLTISGQGTTEAFEHLGPPGDYVGPDNRTSYQWPAAPPKNDKKKKAVHASDVEDKSVSAGDVSTA